MCHCSGSNNKYKTTELQFKLKKEQTLFHQGFAHSGDALATNKDAFTIMKHEHKSFTLLRKEGMWYIDQHITQTHRTNTILSFHYEDVLYFDGYTPRIYCTAHTITLYHVVLCA